MDLKSSLSGVFFNDLTEIFDFVVGQMSQCFKSLICQIATSGGINMKTKMEMIEISKLVPYVNNARTHSPEQIMKLRSSLREFGFINPVIIDSKFNIIAGHGRVMAAKEENMEEVPCVLVDYLSEA